MQKAQERKRIMSKKSKDLEKIERLANNLRQYSDEKLLHLYTTIPITHEAKQAYNIVFKERGIKP